MIRAWLLINEWLQWDKFEQQYRALEEAAADRGVGLVRRSNDWIAAHLGTTPDTELPDVAIVLDKDLHTLTLLESRGVRLVNRAAAVAVCDDKLLTYAALAAAGVPQPETMPVPLAYSPLNRDQWRASEFFRAAGTRLGFPMVFKHAVGSWGQGVFLVDNSEQLLDLLADAPVRSLVQRFAADSSGHDRRLFMAGDRCVAAMDRFGADGDFRANITGGGIGRVAEPTPTQLDSARRAMAALGLETGSVDFLGEEVCEVNSNAQFMTLEQVTGVDVAANLIDHVLSLVSR